MALVDTNDGTRSMKEEAPRDRMWLALPVSCALLVAGVLALRLSLVPTRTFDVDEFQHMHAALSFQQGLLPYRDFFEHHPPGIYFLLEPVFRLHSPAQSGAAVLDALVAARRMMWTIVVVTLILTFVLGSRMFGAAVGWLGTALVSTSVVFVARTHEIRPDVPALACWTASQIALFHAFSLTGARQRRAWLIVAGIAAGLALVLTQKLLLAVPGFALFTASYLLSADDSPRVRRAGDLALFAACCATPFALVLIYFYAHGAGPLFISAVLVGNMGWPQETTARVTLDWMLLRDPLFLATCVAGLIYEGVQLLRTPTMRLPRLALYLPTLAIIVGLGIVPTPTNYYLLPVYPVAALYGAAFVWDGLRQATFGSLAGRAGAVAFCSTAAWGLLVAKPQIFHPAVYPAVGAMVLLAGLTVRRHRSASGAAALVLFAISLYGLQQLNWMRGLSNAEQVAQMRFVHAATTPRDRVMDGFSGLGWFRPQADYHWFLHVGVRARLTDVERQAIVSQLADCEAAPRVVLLDDQLTKVSPDMVPAVERAYQRTAFPIIWVAKPDHCRGFELSRR